MTVANESIRVEDLRNRWEEYRTQNRRAFRFDAARAFGVSEAALLAVECGRGVTRLEGDWRELLKEFHRLGRVMALTRNAHAVHEKKGHYTPVSFQGHVGLVLDDDIDLRLFMHKWTHGFAVVSPESKGHKRSFQFFDSSGESVHKVFVPDDGAAAFDELIDRFRSSDQKPGQEVQAPARPATERPDAEVDAEGLREAWANLKDTHDFFPLLKRFNVRRTQALRLAGATFATPLSVDIHRTVFAEASRQEMPIMIFVGSSGCIQIHSGVIARPFENSGWCNIMGADFNLHLQESGVAEAWLVRKPTADGLVTSVELFDATGQEIAFIFGKRKPGIPEREEWRALCAAL